MHGRVLAAEIREGGTTIDRNFSSKDTSMHRPTPVGLGFVAPWTPGACNNPVLSSLAEPSERALILSWQTSLEGAIGALGSVIFTRLIDILGYDPACNNPCTANENCKGPEENIRVAGLALVLTSSVPWAVCGCLYSCLHCTYPADIANIEAEREQRARIGEGPAFLDPLAVELPTAS